MWIALLYVYLAGVGISLVTYFILVLIKAPKNLQFGDTWSHSFWASVFWFIICPLFIWENLEERKRNRSRSQIAMNIFLDLEFYRQTQMLQDMLNSGATSLDEFVKLHPEMKSMVKGKSGKQIYDMLTKFGIGEEPKEVKSLEADNG